MKKALYILIGIVTLTACSSSPQTKQGGTQSDGIKGVDENGAFPDTGRRGQGYLNSDPRTDTSKGEDRVDISSRDSANIGTKK